MPKIDVGGVVSRKGSNYPEPFRNKAPNRIKQRLGEAAGLSAFGVNLVRLPPGEWSSQRHWHSQEEEFIYVLEGTLTMITDAGEETLEAGDCAGFPAGAPDGHHFINRGLTDAVYLEVGSRDPDDVVRYPDVDLHMTKAGYFRKDGSAY